MVLSQQIICDEDDISVPGRGRSEGRGQEMEEERGKRGRERRAILLMAVMLIFING